MAVQKVSGWPIYKELKFTYILHETIGGDKDVEQDVKQGVEHDVEIVCNVQGAKSLKKVNRLGSSVWDLFKRTKDGKTAKCLICKKVCMTSGNTNNLADHLRRFHPTQNQYKPTHATVNKFFKNDEYDSKSALTRR